jgi:glycosyltransferase involved in cell wall biosynthesis
VANIVALAYCITAEEKRHNVRVLQLISSTGFYGAERVVASLSSNLAAMDCDVTIGLFNGARLADRARFSNEQEGAPKLWDFECRGRFDVAALIRLVHYLRRSQTDVLHAHGYKANLYGFVAANITGCRVVSTCHNWTNRSSLLRRYAALDKRMLPHFDRVFAVSESVAHLVRETGLRSHRVQLILNGVDTTGLQVLPSPADAPWPPVIACLSRLSPEKGVDVLIRALPRILQRFPEARCNVAGEGPERDRLTKLAEELGVVDCLNLLGSCADPWELLAGCTVFVQPSRLDGLPMAILEAMAAARPVVASAIGGIPTLLRDGKLGVLVQPENTEALAEGVLCLLNDSAMRTRMAEQSSSFVRTHYSASLMARQYLQAYADLCGNESTERMTLPAA